MIRIVAQLREREAARVVKLEPGDAVHCLCRIIRILLILLDDLFLRRFKGALKAPDNRHRNDDVLILIALIRSAQLVCDRPDHAGFF